MYEVGEMVEGWAYNDEGEMVRFVGPFKFRTDDPEEYIQDIVITVNGKSVYLDEQECRPYKGD